MINGLESGEEFVKLLMGEVVINVIVIVDVVMFFLNEGCKVKFIEIFG